MRGPHLGTLKLGGKSGTENGDGAPRPSNARRVARIATRQPRIDMHFRSTSTPEKKRRYLDTGYDNSPNIKRSRTEEKDTVKTTESTNAGPSHYLPPSEKQSPPHSGPATLPQPPIENEQARALQSVGANRPLDNGYDDLPEDLLHTVIRFLVPSYSYKHSPDLTPSDRKRTVREAYRQYRDLTPVNQYWRQHVLVLCERAWQTYLTAHLDDQKIHPQGALLFDHAPPIFTGLKDLRDIGERVEALVAKAVQHPDLTLRVLRPLMQQAIELLKCMEDQRNEPRFDTSVMEGQLFLALQRERSRLSVLPWMVLVLAYQHGLANEKEPFDQIVDLVIQHAASLRPSASLPLSFRKQLWKELQELYSDRPDRLEELRPRIEDGHFPTEKQIDEDTQRLQPRASGHLPKLQVSDVGQHLHALGLLRRVGPHLPPSFIRTLSRIAWYWAEPHRQAPPELETLITEQISRLLHHLTDRMTADDRIASRFLFGLFPRPCLMKAIATLSHKSQTRLLQDLLQDLQPTPDQSPFWLPFLQDYIRNVDIPWESRMTLLGNMRPFTHLHHPDVKKALDELWSELTATTLRRFGF